MGGADGGTGGGRLLALAARALPPGPAGRRLVLLALVDAVGTGLFLAGSVLFFTRVVGLSTGQIGLGLSLAGVASFVSLVPLGVLADRWGAQPTLVALQAWRALWFAAYAFVPGMAGFLVVAIALGVAERPTVPITQAVVGAAVRPTERVRTLAIMRSVRNVGFSLGAVLATLVIAADTAPVYRLLVLANAASFAVAAVLLARLRLPTRPRAARRPSPGRALRSFRDGGYVLLAACNGVLYLHTLLLAVAIPLWITEHTAVPAVTVGLVVLLNTVLAVVLQVPLSRGADAPAVAGRRQFQAGVALAACCVLLVLTGEASAAAGIPLVLGATVALTLGEIWQSAGGWGLSYEYAPEDRRSAYLSVYNLGASTATIVGPALLTSAVVDQAAPGWLGLAAGFLAFGAAVPLLVRRRTGRARPVPDPPPPPRRS